MRFYPVSPKEMEYILQRVYRPYTVNLFPYCYSSSYIKFTPTCFGLTFSHLQGVHVKIRSCTFKRYEELHVHSVLTAVRTPKSAILRGWVKRKHWKWRIEIETLPSAAVDTASYQHGFETCAVCGSSGHMGLMTSETRAKTEGVRIGANICYLFLGVWEYQGHLNLSPPEASVW
jgi:hypothetical protein